MIQESFFSKESVQGLGPLNQPIYGIEEILENEKTRKPANLYPKDFDLQKDNLLICGDNAEVMQRLLDMNGGKPFADLIYIDPPFCSNRNYDVKGFDQRGFKDKWESGLSSYLPWLMDRLKLMKSILKENGTLLVHLDWHAAHYVKVELDKLFGYSKFGNEIIWCYAGGGISKGDFPKKHDTILRYKNSNEATYNPEMREYSESTLAVGRHSLTSGGGELNPKGTPINDWWADLKRLTSYNKEWIGYSTQKPEAIVERIIRACSNEGDLVADFFAGSGTTCAVAEKLGRRWLGVDQNPQAIEVAANRIKKLNSEFRILEQKK